MSSLSNLAVLLSASPSRRSGSTEAPNGYRFAEIVGASNPSGWSGMLKVKNPAGVTAGYILLYSNP